MSATDRQLDEILAFSKDRVSELKSLLQIDKFALDEMLMTQPQRYMEVSEQFVIAASYTALAEKIEKEVYSELYAIVKQNSIETGLKLTEEGLRQAIRREPSYRKAASTVIEISRRENHLRALKEAMSSRGFMLRDLVALHSAGYFSENAVKTPQADEAITEGRKRRIVRKPMRPPAN